jgi:hypothetical protein
MAASCCTCMMWGIVLPRTLVLVLVPCVWAHVSSGAGILVRGGDLSWGIPDEDITSMDMHEASPLDIQPIQGPITRARARQLNLEVSSFLSVPINNFNNDLLPIVYNVIRNQGEDQEIHGGRLGGVEGQQGDPLQLKFESNLGSRSCLR